MKRQLNRDRLFISQWYYGGGNRISVFTRRPKKPFEEIKNLYLREVDSLNDLESNKNGISVEQRRKIKERIIRQIRKEEIKSLKKLGLILLISIGILIGLIYFVKYLIELIKFYS